ncbi:MAG: DUF4105 domain-containing protein [Kiloniellales bacterium]|nr:DUF4105 domain-containing protein [Kiloniellales bacterium]
MKVILRRIGKLLIALSIVGAVVWGALALWFILPGDGARILIVGGFTALGVLGLVIGALHRKLIFPLLPFAIAFGTLLVWWSGIEPSNDRDWQQDVARLPKGEIEGTFVTLDNIRDFNYRSEFDYVPRWSKKTYDLRQLDTLDLIAVYWMGDAIAHIMLSFGFGGEQVVISIETRKEKGEEYSALAGFFRRYELYYVVGTERDLIGLRTTYRNPPEDVYLYRVDAPKENIRRLFLEYLGEINQLHEQPEFYNTATANCTTNIVMHVRAFQQPIPVSWKILMSGYFPELIYERGSLDQSLPFSELQGRSLINERARDIDEAEEFSGLIRKGLPGI